MMRVLSILACRFEFRQKQNSNQTNTIAFVNNAEVSQTTPKTAESVQFKTKACQQNKCTATLALGRQLFLHTCTWQFANIFTRFVLFSLSQLATLSLLLEHPTILVARKTSTTQQNSPQPKSSKTRSSFFPQLVRHSQLVVVVVVFLTGFSRSTQPHPRATS